LPRIADIVEKRYQRLLLNLFIIIPMKNFLNLSCTLKQKDTGSMVSLNYFAPMEIDYFSLSPYFCPNSNASP